MATVDVSVAEAGSGTADLTAAINRVADAADRMAASADRSSQSTRNAGQAAGQAAGSFGMLQSAMGNITSSFGMLSGAAGGLLTYLSTQKVIAYADSFTNVENRLRLTSTSTKDLSAKTQEVFDIAQKTRSGFEDSAKVYARLEQALKNMNGTSAKAGPLLTTINQAMALGGASTQAQAGAMEQFQQALQKGVLRGEEFNSVMTGAPALALAIADGLGKPITALKTMADQGQLTAQKVINALGNAGPAVARAFAESTPTIASAFTYVDNALTMYIGSAQKGNTATGLLRQGIMLLGDNLNIVIPIATVFAGLMLFSQVYSGIAAIAQLTLGVAQLAIGFIGLAAAAIVNPMFWAVIAGAVAGVIIAFKMWGDQIVANTAKIPVLGAAMAAVNNMINGKKDATDKDADASKKASSITDEFTGVLGKFFGAAQKAATGTGQHTAAIAANGVQLAATTTLYNSFGEKLETLSQARSRWAAQDKVVADALKITTKAAQDLNGAQAALMASTNGVNTEWINQQAALQGIIPSLDAYGQSVRNIASEAGALGAHIGEFTQAMINSNAAMSNLEKSANGGSAGLKNLSASYGEAAGAAASFASAVAGANTVAGQIGTSSGGFGQNYDENFLPLGRGQSGLGQAEIDRQRFSVIMQQEAYKKKIAAMQASAQAIYGTGTANTANDNGVTSAVRGGTSGVGGGAGGSYSIPNPGMMATPGSTGTNPNIYPTGYNPYATPDQYTPNTTSRSAPAYTPAPQSTPVVVQTTNAMSPPAGSRPITINIKADDYDQFNRSGRQAAQDIANRIAAA